MHPRLNLLAAPLTSIALLFTGCGDGDDPAATGSPSGGSTAASPAEETLTVTAESVRGDAGAPPPPELQVRVRGDHLLIDFAFAEPASGAPDPWLLLSSVDPAGDTPPLTLRTQVDPENPTGTVTQPLGAAEDNYVLRAAVLAKNGRRSAVVEHRFTSP